MASRPVVAERSDSATKRGAGLLGSLLARADSNDKMAASKSDKKIPLIPVPPEKKKSVPDKINMDDKKIRRDPLKKFEKK